MNDKVKIIAGLIIFLVAVTFPVWRGVFADAAPPEVVLPQGEDIKCIESREYMVANHMNLLNQWRDDMVRNGAKTYTATDDTVYEISLTKTCMQAGCHDNRIEFCDRCHEYADVAPYCWDCHVTPDQVSPKGEN